jgi:hypothetical protein
MRKVLLFSIGAAVFVAVLVAIGWMMLDLPMESSAPKAAAPAPASSPGASTVVATPEPAPQAKGTWTYGQNTDKLTGKATQWACLASSNELQFKPPYEGGSTGEVCFRKGQTQDAYFHISRGQISCHTDGCQVHLKAGQDETISLDAAGPRDYDPTRVILSSDVRILAAARRAESFRLEVPFFQEGRQVFIFTPAEPLDSRW